MISLGSRVFSQVLAAFLLGLETVRSHLRRRGSGSKAPLKSDHQRGTCPGEGVSGSFAGGEGASGPRLDANRPLHYGGATFRWQTHTRGSIVIAGSRASCSPPSPELCDRAETLKIGT